MNRKYYLLVSLFLSTACTSVVGTITDAEGYLIIGEIKKSYELAAYTAAKTNMPIGIVDKNGQFYFLSVNATDFDVLIHEQVKIKGKIDQKHKVILPKKVWYFDEVESKWKAFQ